MKKLLDLMEGEIKKAFEEAGLDPAYAKVVLSNRPDLCEYQCNGAMAAAKAYKKKPIDIADQVVGILQERSGMFSQIQAVMPGFINLKLSEEFLARYMGEMSAAPKLGVEEPEKKKPSLWTTAGPMWPSLFMWDTCALR